MWLVTTRSGYHVPWEVRVMEAGYVSFCQRIWLFLTAAFRVQKEKLKDLSAFPSLHSQHWVQPKPTLCSTGADIVFNRDLDKYTSRKGLVWKTNNISKLGCLHFPLRTLYSRDHEATSLTDKFHNSTSGNNTRLLKQLCAINYR